jgi:hypothetical protein
MIRKLDLFASSGEESEIFTLLGLLERANIDQWTDPVSEPLCFLIFRIPDDRQTSETH